MKKNIKQVSLFLVVLFLMMNLWLPYKTEAASKTASTLCIDFAPDANWTSPRTIGGTLSGTVKVNNTNYDMLYTYPYTLFNTTPIASYQLYQKSPKYNSDGTIASWDTVWTGIKTNVSTLGYRDIKNEEFNVSIPIVSEESVLYIKIWLTDGTLWHDDRPFMSVMSYYSPHHFYTGTINGDIAISREFVSLSTDKPSYNLGDTVNVTVKMKHNYQAIEYDEPGSLNAKKYTKPVGGDTLWVTFPTKLNDNQSFVIPMKMDPLILGNQTGNIIITYYKNNISGMSYMEDHTTKYPFTIKINAPPPSVSAIMAPDSVYYDDIQDITVTTNNATSKVTLNNSILDNNEVMGTTSWIFNKATFDDGKTPEPTLGPLTLTATAYNADGLTALLQKQVTVKAHDPVISNVTSSKTSVYAGENIPLIVTTNKYVSQLVITKPDGTTMTVNSSIDSKGRKIGQTTWNVNVPSNGGNGLTNIHVEAKGFGGLSTSRDLAASLQINAPISFDNWDISNTMPTFGDTIDIVIPTNAYVSKVVLTAPNGSALTLDDGKYGKTSWSFKDIPIQLNPPKQGPLTLTATTYNLVGGVISKSNSSIIVKAQDPNINNATWRGDNINQQAGAMATLNITTNGNVSSLIIDASDGLFYPITLNSNQGIGQTNWSVIIPVGTKDKDYVITVTANGPTGRPFAFNVPLSVHRPQVLQSSITK